MKKTPPSEPLSASVETPSFHAQHAPMGAHASLTLGMFRARGGMALEKGGPGPGGLYAGYRDEQGVLRHLPFFEVREDESARYTGKGSAQSPSETLFTESEVSREYLWATDRFRAPRLVLEVLTPFFSLPDPAHASADELKFASCPAIFVRLDFDNRRGAGPITGFFGATLGRESWTPLEEKSGGTLIGAVSRGSLGFATRARVSGFIDFSLPAALQRTHKTPYFLLGSVAGFTVAVPAGQRAEVLVACGFFNGVSATWNVETTYWYRRYFPTLVEVLAYALDHAPRYLEKAALRDAELAAAPLNDEQKFMIAHATRSYYGSTQWLDRAGEPCWVVNEGEYLMMNTFDLTVDMLFHEMRMNPWTVRNVLDHYASRYSYRDQIFDPARPRRLLPGGVSFTHDMGVAGHWSPAGHSSYEVSGLDRACFSHMTGEQLVNWILCAGVYYASTRDADFLRTHAFLLAECLESLERRDHPDPKRRDGVLKFESSRTWPGGEITTYDSLDPSLGQARNNLYLAVKTWAAYLALEQLFTAARRAELARGARAGARSVARTVAGKFDNRLGYIPAVFEGANKSAIIPAIEGLIFPHAMGLKKALSPSGPYRELLAALRRHFEAVLVPGTCLYPDGGWKLSSTSDNSWMSKIGLCMHVARSVLGLDFGDRELVFDRAHARWQRNGATFHACSDQFHSGVAKGSLYYPRIVTSVLWLEEGKK